MTEALTAYQIGVDQPTKYGPDWEGAFLAGSEYSEYDDNNYFTVEMRLLVHPSVDKTVEAVEQRLKCIAAEGFRSDGLMGMSHLDESGDGIVYWEDIDSMPVEMTMKHGIVVAYRPYVDNDVDMGWDGSHILDIEGEDGESDLDEDE